MVNSVQSMEHIGWTAVLMCFYTAEGIVMYCNSVMLLSCYLCFDILGLEVNRPNLLLGVMVVISKKQKEVKPASKTQDTVEDKKPQEGEML